MARSKYIYIVRSTFNAFPIAAFTVKHEMQSFVARYPGEVFIERFLDGQQGPIARVETEKALEESYISFRAFVI